MNFKFLFFNINFEPFGETDKCHLSNFDKNDSMLFLIGIKSLLKSYKIKQIYTRKIRNKNGAEVLTIGSRIIM